MAHPITYLLPTYRTCVLINGDYTGLSEEDKKEIEDFLKTAEGSLPMLTSRPKVFTDTTMPVHCLEIAQISPF